ncbi:MAG: radical SAM/SPASM domain-containing protein [bacterium]
MKEIPLRYVLKTITLRRLLNAVQAIAAFLLSALTKRTVLWGEPFILTVEPTNLCNLKCPLCVTGNGRMQRQAGQMSFELFQEIVDRAGDKIFYLLMYHQGEPYLNREFLRCVEYAKHKRILVTTSTNGHYLTPEAARQTVACGLDSIIISIDGADQPTYGTYRVGGELDKVLTGVRNLVGEKKRQKSKTPVIYLQFLVMQHNEHQIPAMRKLTVELGADQFLIKKVQVESAEEAARWLPSQESLRRYACTDGTLRPRRSGQGVCPRPWTSTLVNWDGSVVPCCFAKNGEHVMGSFAGDGKTRQIWKSGDYATFRERMLTNRDGIAICANCSQGLELYL